MPTEHRKSYPKLATLILQKTLKKANAIPFQFRFQINSRAGVLERVEVDDTRDHQKAANLVKCEVKLVTSASSIHGPI